MDWKVNTEAKSSIDSMFEMDNRPKSSNGVRPSSSSGISRHTRSWNIYSSNKNNMNSRGWSNNNEFALPAQKSGLDFELEDLDCDVDLMDHMDTNKENTMIQGATAMAYHKYEVSC